MNSNYALKTLAAFLTAFLFLSAGPLRTGESVDLAGSWKFSKEDNASFARADADDSSWQNIRLPGFWQRQGFEGHSGYAWARRKITVPSGANAPVALRMDGLYDEAEIFVNGERAGFARGAIGMNANLFPIPEPALVDVSGKFKAGENVVAIRFYDNPSKGEWIYRDAPFPSFQGLAGIEKRISLEMAPAVFIRGVFIRVADKASAECRFQFEVSLENRGGSPVAATLLLDASGKSAEKKVTVAPGRSVEMLEVKSRPEFGSKTYRLDLKSERGADSVTGNWHTVVVDERGGKIFVNGEVFIVKGLNGHLLWSEPVKQDLAELLQDVGVNLLRQPQGSQLWFKDYEKYSSVMLCPVVSGNFSCKEIGDWKTLVPKKNYTFEDSATNELEDYIRSASESPLLFGWNTANEIATANKPENEKALISILETMRSKIRSVDSYARPAIYANLMWNDQRVTEAQELCGFNYYVDPDSFDFSILKDLCKDKPFVFTETDLPSGYWKPPFWNNTGLHTAYQTKLYNKMLAAGGSGVMLYSGLFDYFNRHIGLLGGDWRKPNATLTDLKLNPEYRDWLRWLYRDFDYETSGGKIKIKNLMPYALRRFKLTSGTVTTEEVVSIPPGGEATFAVGGGAIRAIYDTHSGLKRNTSFDPAKHYILPTPDLGDVQKSLVRKEYAWKEALSVNGSVSSIFGAVETGKAGAENGLKGLENVSKEAKASPAEASTDPKEGSVVKLSFQFGTEGVRNDWVRYSFRPSVTDVSEWDGLAIRIKNDGKVRRVNVVLFDEAGKPADIWSTPPLFEKDWQTVTFLFKNKEQLRENSTAQIDQLDLKKIKTIRLQIDDYVVKEEIAAEDAARIHQTGPGEMWVGEIALVKIRK